MLTFDEPALLESVKNSAGIIPYKTDVRVWFFVHATKDHDASAKLGRPIYTNAIYRGSKGRDCKDFMSAPIAPDDPAQYPAEWEAFQASRVNPKTSIRSLPKLTPAAFLTLQELSIYTIEDFAARDPLPELVELHGVAKQWVALNAGIAETPKRKGGWPKGKARK